MSNWEAIELDTLVRVTDARVRDRNGRHWENGLGLVGNGRGELNGYEGTDEHPRPFSGTRLKMQHIRSGSRSLLGSNPAVERYTAASHSCGRYWKRMCFSLTDQRLLPIEATDRRCQRATRNNLSLDEFVNRCTRNQESLVHLSGEQHRVKGVQTIDQKNPLNPLASGSIGATRRNPLSADWSPRLRGSGPQIRRCRHFLRFWIEGHCH
jgi:hypothetical protein